MQQLRNLHTKKGSTPLQHIMGYVSAHSNGTCENESEFGKTANANETIDTLYVIPDGSGEVEKTTKSVSEVVVE